MASAVMMNPLKQIHNTPDWPKQRAKEGKITSLSSSISRTSSAPRVVKKPISAPTITAVVPQPAKEEVKENGKEELKTARVKKIYSREFLIKFRYSAPAFPPGALTPADLIAQYNKDYEARLLQLQQESSETPATPSEPAAPAPVPPTTSIPQTKQDGASTKDRKTEKQAKEGGEKKREKPVPAPAPFKLRLGGDDSILRSPMFRASAAPASAPAKSARAAPVADDKENGSSKAAPPKRSEPATKAPKEKKEKKEKREEKERKEKREKKQVSPTASLAPTPAMAPAVPAPTPTPVPQEVPVLSTPAPTPAPAPQEVPVLTTPVTSNVEMKDAKEDAVDAITSKLKAVLKETDARRLAQRQKQIDYGKATSGYTEYVKLVAKSKRKREDPKTPNKHQVCSKRSWDGQIRKWRRMLHFYDPTEQQGKEDIDMEGEGEEESEVTEAEIAAEELALRQ